MQNRQNFNEFIKAQAEEWANRFGKAQDTYMIDMLNDETKAQKLLSKNWVCLYPDFIGFPSVIKQKKAIRLFNENHI